MNYEEMSFKQAYAKAVSLHQSGLQAELRKFLSLFETKKLEKAARYRHAPRTHRLLTKFLANFYAKYPLALANI
jgi:hypothetical protein